MMTEVQVRYWFKWGSSLCLAIAVIRPLLFAHIVSPDLENFLLLCFLHCAYLQILLKYKLWQRPPRFWQYLWWSLRCSLVVFLNRSTSAYVTTQFQFRSSSIIRCCKIGSKFTFAISNGLCNIYGVPSGNHSVFVEFESGQVQFVQYMEFWPLPSVSRVKPFYIASNSSTYVTLHGKFFRSSSTFNFNQQFDFESIICICATRHISVANKWFELCAWYRICKCVHWAVHGSNAEHACRPPVISNYQQNVQWRHILWS